MFCTVLVSGFVHAECASAGRLPAVAGLFGLAIEVGRRARRAAVERHRLLCIKAHKADAAVQVFPEHLDAVERSYGIQMLFRRIRIGPGEEAERVSPLRYQQLHGGTVRILLGIAKGGDEFAAGIAGDFQI
jgi:hypothetical protein